MVTTEKRISWDHFFMMMAVLWGTRTTCLNKGVGAVIVVDKRVIAAGFNGAVPGAEHCVDRGHCQRREKGFGPGEGYEWSRASHAEQNAVANAARYGISVIGGTIYIPYYPCANCMKILAVAGIKRVVYLLPPVDEHAPVIAAEAGIECVELKMGCDICKHHTSGYQCEIPEIRGGLRLGKELDRQTCEAFAFNDEMTIGWVKRKR